MMQQPLQQPQSQQQQFDQQNQEFWRNRTVVSVDVSCPESEAITQLAQQLQQRTGLKEVSLRREGNDSRTPHLRIQATPEGITDLQQVLPQVIQTIQQAYTGSRTSR